jgi:hypothetical protein
MAIERRRVELGQHEDAPNIRMQAVTDRNVDEAELTADRHRRFRPPVRERKKPAALAAAEDQCENISGPRHLFTVHPSAEGRGSLAGSGRRRTRKSV